MVKYGECVIRCEKCDKGCAVKTQIQRNSAWDYGIVTQTCPHGHMLIDMYTCNSFAPFGEPDSIKFRVRFNFSSGSGYTGTFEREFSRSSTQAGEDKASYNCVSVVARFTGNALGDYVSNAMGAGIVGLFVGEYYETRRFGIDGSLPTAPSAAKQDATVEEQKRVKEAKEKEERARKEKEEREAKEKKEKEERARKEKEEREAKEKKEKEEREAKEKKEKEEREAKEKKEKEEREAKEKKEKEEREAKEKREKEERESKEKRENEERARKEKEEREAKEKEEREAKEKEEREAKEKREKEERARKEKEEREAKEKEEREAKEADEVAAKRNTAEKHGADQKTYVVKAASRWKAFVATHMRELRRTAAADRWQKIVEALVLNKQGIKLYEEGKLKEAASQIWSALEMYEKAVAKFKDAAIIQPLKMIFNSFVLLLDAFIKNHDYDEAQKTIDLAKKHFPEMVNAFAQAERMIAEGNWSPNYTKEFLLKVDQQAQHDNIVQLADRYEN